MNNRQILNSLLLSCLLVPAAGCGSAPPQLADEFVHCRSLDGERTALKILAWKFDAVSAELAAICAPGQAMSVEEITKRTLRQLSPELRESLGEPVECIDLTLKELEVRGAFVRSANTENQPELTRMI